MGADVGGGGGANDGDAGGFCSGGNTDAEDSDANGYDCRSCVACLDPNALFVHHLGSF